MKLLVKIKHIIKELANDPLFQVRKIYLRVFFLLNGIYKSLFFYKKQKKINSFNVVIYSLGKSGSSSLFYTFFKEYPFKRFFHVHFLSDYWLYKIFPGTPHERNIHKAEAYFRYIKKHSTKKIKYISLVREPISRDISGFFQNYRLMNISFDKNNLEEIRKIICERGHDLALNWFDTDFKNYTGFDIFKLPFDKKKGYKIYSINNREELLIIRTDKLSDVFNVALKEFLSIDINKLFNFNVSSQKKDGEIIDNLKRYYFEPEENLNKIYESKFMKYFFTKDEINNYRNRWSKR